MGTVETEAGRCWRCGAIFEITQYDPVILDDEDTSSMMVCMGAPDPGIPTNVLQNLVDAADQQLNDLMEQWDSLANDPMAMQIIGELRKSVTFVQRILRYDKTDDIPF
jgi:hypothetical protein